MVRFVVPIFYMIHPFEEAELHLLIDGLLASRHISVNQRKDLIVRYLPWEAVILNPMETN